MSLLQLRDMLLKLSACRTPDGTVGTDSTGDKKVEYKCKQDETVSFDLFFILKFERLKNLLIF